MKSEWFVHVGGKELGPFSDQQLRAMAAKSQITQFTPVRKGTSGNWVLASRIRGLFEDSPEALATSERAKGPAEQTPRAAELKRATAIEKRSAANRESNHGVRIWKSIGNWALAVIGGLLLLSTPIGIIEEPHRWLTSVLIGIVGICMLPFGWNWFSDRLKFVRRYGTATRWMIGLTAMTLAGAVGSDKPGNARRSTPTPTLSSYSVVSTIVVSENRMGLVVLLKDRVSEDTLRAVATEIKDAQQQFHDVAQIAFYLPGMKIGAGAWAMADFNPALNVRMIGLSVEQEKAISQPPASPARQVIGSWWDEWSIVKNRTTYYRENGKVFKENRLDDGSARVVEMQEVDFPTGRRYTYKPDNGDYFIINDSGNLEWWDEDGHYLTSRKAN